MSRKYVIMRDNQDEYEPRIVEPFDVVSTMEKAEEICKQQENPNESWVYYWREVISSED